VLLAAAACAGLVLAYLRWRPTRVAVEGGSMRPTLEPGEWAIAVAPRAIRPGDVVVVQHPARPDFEMVKRVVAGPGDVAPDGVVLSGDELWVEGDDPAGSTDSRQFGPVHLAQVKGSVVLVYWPPERRRLVRWARPGSR
jgi:signal peptidase I